MTHIGILVTVFLSLCRKYHIINKQFSKNLSLFVYDKLNKQLLDFEQFQRAGV